MTKELDKRKFSLLFSMLTCNNNKLKEVFNRQISVNYDNEDSFFCKIRQTLAQYELPSLTQIQPENPSKYKWKKLIKEKIGNYWTNSLIEQARTKKSLGFLDIEKLKMGTCHPV